MSVYPYAQTFYEYDSEGGAASASDLGPVYQVVWDRGVDFEHTRVRGGGRLTKAGGTDPVLSVTVLGSHDGENWFDFALAFELTGVTTDASQTGTTLKGVNFIRGKLTSSGTGDDRPSGTAWLFMAATHPFVLTLVT